MEKKTKTPEKGEKSDVGEHRKQQVVSHRPLAGVQAQFLVDSYDGNGSEIDTQYMSRKEVLALDLESYDCCRAKCLGVFGFRHPGSREWIEYGTKGEDGKNRNRIGPISMMILEVIQWFPGVFHTPKMLSQATGLKCLLNSSKVNTEVCRLRTAHYEDKATEHFIITKDGVAWPRDIPWIAVQPLLFTGKDFRIASTTENDREMQSSVDNS